MVRFGRWQCEMCIHMYMSYIVIVWNICNSSVRIRTSISLICRMDNVYWIYRKGDDNDATYYELCVYCVCLSSVHIPSSQNSQSSVITTIFYLVSSKPYNMKRACRHHMANDNSISTFYAM